MYIGEYSMREPHLRAEAGLPHVPLPQKELLQAVQDGAVMWVLQLEMRAASADRRWRRAGRVVFPRWNNCNVRYEHLGVPRLYVGVERMLKQPAAFNNAPWVLMEELERRHR